MPGKERPAVKLTYEDYCCIPEDGMRHEILDGERVVSPAPRLDHQTILGNLYAQLRVVFQDPGLGRVFLAPTDLRLSQVDILQPDLMVILRDNLSILTPANVKGVPDLVIEILSPSTVTRDRTLKKERYQIAGVLEYWIVLIDERVVEQYVLDGHAYRLARRCAGELRPTTMPDARIDVPKLWENPCG